MLLYSLCEGLSALGLLAQAEFLRHWAIHSATNERDNACTIARGPLGTNLYRADHMSIVVLEGFLVRLCITSRIGQPEWVPTPGERRPVWCAFTQM